VTEEQHAAALLAAAIDARDYGAIEIAVILSRALLARYPLSEEAAQALQYLRDTDEIYDPS
jgi:hypothetical protein